jgi:Leucine-rich repeat (LRR) protein
MEEYDELSVGPDKKGVLDLSHNAWSELPDILFTYSTTLLSLDLSMNKLTEVEPDFGKLKCLSSLNLRGNMIERVSPNIGMCIRLKYINLSENRISEIPGSIGNCTLLEEMYLGSNYITTMPGSVGNIIALRILNLQDNALESLPHELGRILTIQEIHCGGNPRLTMIPDEMRGTSDLVIWALQLHRDQIDNVEEKTAVYSELEGRCRESEEMRLRLRDETSDLQIEIRDLEDIRPDVYIAMKAKAIGAIKVVKCPIM